MVLRNSRKIITCAVGVKEYFPGSLIFVCKIRVSGDSGLFLIIEKGIITKVEGDSFAAQRLRDILAKMEDSEIIGEVAVGLNDKSLINGNVQEEKKALGNVHIGFGVARIFKGTWLENLKKDIHSDIVIRKAIVKLDNKEIVRNNELLI